MFNPRKPVFGGVVFALVCFSLIEVPSAGTSAAPIPKNPDVRKYGFTAQVTKNGGVTPFRVGATIIGTFTYTVKTENSRPANLAKLHGLYKSAQNSLTFEVGELRYDGMEVRFISTDLRFIGAGEVMVSVGALPDSEHFGIAATGLKLPKGWEMDHTGHSKSYGILLQNAPTKKRLAGSMIPNRISLDDFESTRELRLDFFHGVRFPGGEVKERATVYATLGTIKEVSP